MGQVMTVSGPIAPERLGAVLMHEHIYSDIAGMQEGPTPPERVELLRAYCAPFLKRLNEYGCHGFVDCTPIPMRAEPWVYQEMAARSGLNIVMSTGFYREAAADEARPCGAGIANRWLDPRIMEYDADAIADIMVGEFEEGIHGSQVKPGIIKLASTSSELTPGEVKTFQAGAKAQQQTGLAITTHVQGLGTAEAQLNTLEAAGADASRVILGHTAWHVVEIPWVVRSLMERGAMFLLTNLRTDGPAQPMARLVTEIRRLFDDGFGDHLALGLDWAFENEQGVFIPCSFMPPPPYIYMFTHTLPRFRELGLEEEALERMLVHNPARVLPMR
ncbi:MAG: hypothetical protein GX620_15425 [Chloroflexi bacterium]|nr:hypothetical protein [Chloroflexota bacterium]